MRDAQKAQYGDLSEYSLVNRAVFLDDSGLFRNVCRDEMPIVVPAALR